MQCEKFEKHRHVEEKKSLTIPSLKYSYQEQFSKCHYWYTFSMDIYQNAIILDLLFYSLLLLHWTYYRQFTTCQVFFSAMWFLTSCPVLHHMGISLFI